MQHTTTRSSRQDLRPGGFGARVANTAWRFAARVGAAALVISLGVLGLAVGSALAAEDRGPRQHAAGQYEASTTTYTVVANDDLAAIAARFGTTVGALKRRNTLAADTITVGQTLVVAAAGTAGAADGDTPTIVVNPHEAQAIAQEAFVYAYPMLFNYKTLYQYTQDYQTTEYAGGFGRFRNYARAYTPADTTIVTVNNDTPYSFAWVDLRAEPWVLSVPAVPTDRYYTHQLVDLYSYNYAYVGLRATGNGAGNYLLAGPDWKGGTPDGIAKVLQAETQLVFIGGRTELKDLKDMPNVVAIQREYRLRPLSEFLAATPPPPAPQLAFPTWDEKRAMGPDFISYLNFMLQFAPTVPSEEKLMARFAKIGIGAGRNFNAASLDTKLLAAIEAGIKAAEAQLKEAAGQAKSSAGLFGTPKKMRSYSDGYQRRAVAAMLGLYGNSVEEADYTPYLKDKDGKPLSGNNRYVIHLNPPPVKYFWSLTMYDSKQLLVANPINRYKLSSASEGLVKNSDGSVTLYIQHDAPTDPKQNANWLPAPEGNLFMVLRMYGPEKQIIDGTWKSPPVELAK